ncbi:hypothetical protein BGZ81_003949 [Podila clonocystis]|nr:hypothetical protein BGZ81_003949 [Podila clonocystis]
MVSIVALVLAPILLGAMIYGATVIYANHHASAAHKDTNNATDLLNATIHTASAISTLSWHYSTTMAKPLINTSPTASKPMMQPKGPTIIFDTPTPTSVPLHDGKEPQDEEEDEKDNDDDKEDDEEHEEEEAGTAAGKASTPRPNPRAFAEWMVGRVLEGAERSPPPTDLPSTDLSRSENAIGKENEESDEHNVISTDAKEDRSVGIGSTKMALPRSPSQARVR